MSAEVERRLRDALDRMPAPGADATRRARSAALATLPAAQRHRHGRLLLVLGAVAVAVALGAAALAATGKLRVGAQTHPAPPPVTELTLPAETHGIALVAGGKLWLATRAGLRIEGMPASTAELSPRALYAAVGIGSSLVALAPGRRRAWTHATAGAPVAASWSPDGLKIAYVVRGRTGMQLRLIEGDGDHDRLLDVHVAPVKPAWRHDSLAITYVRRRGRMAVFDLATGNRLLGARVARPKRLGRVSALSRRGDRVAVAVRRPHRIVELRIFARGARHGTSALLLRVRVPPSPVTISWR
jgi:hypothetical protein